MEALRQEAAAAAAEREQQADASKRVNTLALEKVKALQAKQAAAQRGFEERLAAAEGERAAVQVRAVTASEIGLLVQPGRCGSLAACPPDP